jgi:trigger factor
MSPRDDHQVELTITLGPERTEKAVQRGARAVAQRAKIPGFRPGKAPTATVLRLYGRDTVLGEVVDDIGREVYEEALADANLEPYAQAELADLTLDPVSFKMVVPLPPTVEMGDYAAIRVVTPAVDVTEADVEAGLEQARVARATLGPVARAAALGDTAVVDIKGTVDGTTIMENEAWELVLKGGGGWLPGFDEAFVGLSAGDAKSFTLIYPEDSTSKYKGQEATFAVSMREVKAKSLPDLTDEFVKELGDYSDLVDYRARRLDQLKAIAADEAQEKLDDDAVRALVDASTFAYPPAAVDAVVHEMLEELARRVGQAGYRLEDYLKLQGTSMQQYHDSLQPAAEQRLKARLALREFARLEGIAVEGTEIDVEIDRLVAGSPESDDTGKLRELLSSEGGRRMLENDLVLKKTFERLRGVVTGQVTPQPAPVAVDADSPNAGAPSGS